MEFFFFGLLSLGMLGFFIGLPIFLLVRTAHLRGEIASIKRELALLKQAPPKPEAPEATHSEKVAPPPQKAPAQPTPQQVSASPPSPLPGAPERSSRKREDEIGGKWSVWIGGITLAIGGVFLVKYAIDNTLLGPTARIFMGLLLGLGLLATGEWTRRRPNQFSLPGFASANIPATLTASGTLVLFAATYAAYAFYTLIGTGTAFIALGAVALLTLLAALLHGPALAALGLLGSYVVPFLVTSDDPSLIPVTIYVLAVSSAGVAMGRLRKWLWLAGAAAAGLLFYAFLFELAATQGDRLLLNFYLTGALAILFGGFVWRFHTPGPETKDALDLPATVALSLFALPLACHVQFQPDLGASFYEAFLLIGLSCAAAYYFSALRYLPFLPLAALLWLYLHFDLPLDLASLPATSMILPKPAEVTDAFSNFTFFGVAMGLSLAAIGTIGSLRAQARATLASMGVTGVLGLIVIAYWRLESWQISWEFAALALAFAAFCALFADFLGANRKVLSQDGATFEGALAAWLVGALAGLGFAACYAFAGASLTVSLGLLPPILVLAQRRYPLPILRALTPIAILPYVARLLWDPIIAGAQLSPTPLFNALLWGYGVPALGLIAAAAFLTRQKIDLWSEIMQALAITLSVVALAMLGLHAISPQFDFASSENMLEATALLVLIGGGVALGLTRISALARPRSILPVAATGLSTVGMGLGLISLFLTANPLIANPDMGQGLLINRISFAFGLPFLLYAALAFAVRDKRSKTYFRAVSGFAAIMGFTWLNLEIRNIFSPGDLTAHAIGQVETYIYSITWLLLGIGCLVVGFMRSSLMLRRISAALVTLAVLKVFLVDMASLEGALRALSFIGLGLALIGIGYLYQRMIRRHAPATGPGTSPE